MNRSLLFILFLASGLLLSASFVLGEIPRIISYQGYMTDDKGKPIDDPDCQLTFRIWNHETASAPENQLWTSGQQVVAVDRGHVLYYLGSNEQLSDDIFNGTERWLGIQIESNEEITPRIRLASMPYAFRVGTIDGANGGIISGDVGIEDVNAPLHLYRINSSITNPQAVLCLNAVSTGDYGEFPDFGPQISFSCEDDDGNEADDREVVRISGVTRDVNSGTLNIDILGNGIWRRMLTLSHPGYWGSDNPPSGLSINSPSFSRGALNVSNFSANHYAAYFESIISTQSNVLIGYLEDPQPPHNFLVMETNTSTPTPDWKFRFQVDGNAFADGAWTGGGADYAEWFEKEGNIPAGSLIGLNIESGRMRVWQIGDPFIGVQSINPGFIGNNVHGADTEGNEHHKNYVLVALIGQVEIEKNDIVEKGRKIYTSDGQFIGWRLSDGKVFLKSFAGVNTLASHSETDARIERLEERVEELRAIVELRMAQERCGLTNSEVMLGLSK